MLRRVASPNWKVVTFVMLVLLGTHVVAFRSGNAQSLEKAAPQYRAEIVPTAAGAGGLEAVLNKYAADGYEVFDIDRAADGSVLLVLQKARE